MDSNLFMGLYIAATLVLLSGFGVIAAHIVRPVINLNKSITKLQDSVDRLEEHDSDFKERAEKQEKKIEKINEQVVSHETRIAKLEVRRRQ